MGFWDATVSEERALFMYTINLDDTLLNSKLNQNATMKLFDQLMLVLLW